MASTPQFAATPNRGTPKTITTANTALDGTGTTDLILTAGASGTFLRRIIARHRGTNVATVLRIFRNNGSDPTVAANNALIGERTIAANTLSQVAESTNFEIFFNLPLANAERIYATIGTAVAGGVVVSVDAGDF